MRAGGEGKGEQKLLDALALVDACAGSFWCIGRNGRVIENPVSRLNRWLGEPVMYFDAQRVRRSLRQAHCAVRDGSMHAFKVPVEATEGQESCTGCRHGTGSSQQAQRDTNGICPGVLRGQSRLAPPECDLLALATVGLAAGGTLVPDRGRRLVSRETLGRRHAQPFRAARSRLRRSPVGRLLGGLMIAAGAAVPLPPRAHSGRTEGQVSQRLHAHARASCGCCAIVTSSLTWGSSARGSLALRSNV